MTSTTTPLLERRAVERARWPEGARVRARALATVVGGVALATLLGYAFGVERLVRLAPGVQNLKFNTALSLLLLAVARIVERPALRRVLLLLVVVLAVLALGEYGLDVGLGIDQLVVSDRFRLPSSGAPGRPSQLALIGIVSLCAGASLVGTSRRALAQLVVAPAIVIGLVAIYGYCYDAPSLYAVAGVSRVAPQTALCLVLMALAWLYAVPLGLLQWISYGKDAGAALLRWLVPVAVVLLPMLGWVLVRAVHDERMSWQLADALMVTLVAGVVVGAGLRAGRVALRADTERERILDELAAVNQQLEERVRVRSAELNLQRTRVALFEERDRIARDLHDRVIQRIFAAGLQVAGQARVARKLAGGGDDLGLSENLDGVAVELDLAIRELRHSIFELTSAASLDEVSEVVTDVAQRASRILGFSPQVLIQPDLRLPPEVTATVAAVLQEALSNVARHAHAASVTVEVGEVGGTLEVVVTDDGAGMPDPLPRSSGVANILNRAVALGGAAAWSHRPGGGTVLTWSVPRI